MSDILTMFERFAASSPDAPALRCAGRAIGYGALDRRACRVAAALTVAGVDEEDLVGVLLERGPHVPEAILGTWKRRAAFVPLAPTDPPQRLMSLLEDCGVRVVITRRHLAAGLPRDVHAVCLDELRTADARWPASEPVPPNRLAYAIYTSGSTGAPKAALIEHRGLIDLGRWMRDGPLAIGSADRVLQWAAPTVDAYLWELTLALGCGGALVIPPPDVDFQTLEAVIAGEQVTIATLTPTVWRRLNEVAIARLRVAISAGEAFTPELAARLSSAGAVVNAYGPTEATICATAAVGAAPDRVTIGRPVGGATVAIAGGGAEGELLIGGSGVGRGYLGRPGLTAERFVPDAGSPLRGARMYHSGDLVRRTGDGELEFLGRVDDQVKVRGFRVELGEVEAALQRLPGVVAAATVARQDGDGGTSLISFVVLEPGVEVPSATLRAQLRSLLPEHMVPARLHALAEMPLTPWGKLDRHALREPGSSPAQRAAPSSRMEQEVLAIWRGVLGNERLGPDDDFFDVGGDSLLAMRVVGRLRQEKAHRLAVRDLFEHPTVASLAAHLESVS